MTILTVVLVAVPSAMIGLVVGGSLRGAKLADLEAEALEAPVLRKTLAWAQREIDRLKPLAKAHLATVAQREAALAKAQAANAAKKALKLAA